MTKPIKPQVVYGPLPEYRKVTDLLPGDRWLQSDDEVEISAVSCDGTQVVVTGRIVKGWGKRKTPYTWTFVNDQELWVVRP